MLRYLVRSVPVLGFFILSSMGQVSAQSHSVVPDGQTDTTVTHDDNGRALVDIAAPVTDGISHNSFTHFNVTEAGLDFDNRFVGARTIISEVTGSERSLIEGDIEILGQRAHLYIANQNGILVNGSEFINTGGVVLTTGRLDFVERVPAPFRTQLNPTFDVTQGQIVIGEDGMLGAMDTLYFLSKSLRVEGAVTNENTSAFSSIQMVTGHSQSEFDSSQFPQNDLSQWGSVTPGEVEHDPDVDSAYLIEITETGGLSAAQISALVTDAGAGVRHAGSILADRQGFSLSVDGSIFIDGGETSAASDVLYSGRQIDIRGEVSFVPEDSLDLVPIEPSTSSEDIYLDDGTLIFTEEDPTLDLSDGLDAEDTEIDGEVPETRAVFNSGFGSVELIATEGPITIGPSLITSREGVEIISPEAVNIDSVEMFTNGAINLEGTSITITSGDDRSFLAAGEVLSITASDGAVILEGARLQGAVLENDDEEGDDDKEEEVSGDSAYALSITSPADIIMRSLDSVTLAVLFGVEGDIYLDAGGDIINHTGRIIANGDIMMTAGGDIDNIVSLPGGSNVPTIYRNNDKSGRLWWTGFTRRRNVRGVIIDYGDLDIEDELAFITATGSLMMTASGDIRNIGGQINANDGDIALTASNLFTEGIITGMLEYERRCSILCSSNASSSLNVLGGSINASGTLKITAENSIENIGGFLTGLEGVMLEAEHLLFESIFLPQVVDRPGGLYNFWSGHSAWLYWRDSLGGAFTGVNNIEVRRAKKLILKGVELEKLISNIDPTIIYAPRIIGSAYDQKIGFFHDLELFIGN